MLKVKILKRFCAVLFVFCLVVFMSLAPTKNYAKAYTEHFIMIEDAFDGFIYVEKGCGNEELPIIENEKYSLMDIKSITIVPNEHLLIRVITPNFNGDYESIKTITTYENIYPTQIYIKTDIDEGSSLVETNTVTFLGNNDEVLEEQTVEQGESAIAPNAPIEEGLIFMGWDNDFDNITQNITVKAIYEPIKHNVEFCIEGQSYISKIQYGQTVDTNSDYYKNLPLEKDLHTFIHFYKQGENQDYAFDFANTPITEELTLIALFEKTQCLVTYMNNDDVELTRVVSMGAAAEELSIEDSYQNYFLGWRKSGQTTYYDFLKPINEDITLIAHIVSQICYVTYIEKGQQDKEIKIEKNTKAGFMEPATQDEFIGWQKADANNINYDFEQTVNEDLELYAVYESDIITIIIDLDGGNAENYIQEQRIRKGFDYVLPHNPEKEAFTFFEWDVVMEGNVKTITALYNPNLTVTYYIQYPFSQALICFVAPNLPYNTTLEFVEVYEYDIESQSQNIIMLQKGWEFLYWHQEGENEAYTNTIITSDLQLYAKIRLKKYPIHFYYEDIESVVQIEHGQAISEFDIPAPTEGHFYVWKDEYGAVYDLAQIIEQETFLYAEKSTIMINVEYQLIIEQEDFSYVEQIEYGDSANMSQLQSNGYTILWYFEQECCQPFDFSLSLVKDTKIYGLATPNLYNITIDLYDDYGLENKVFEFYYNDEIFLDTIMEYGYTHNGLFYQQEEDVPFELKKMPAYDITLYVILQKEMFTICYQIGEEILCQEQYEYLTTITLKEGEPKQNENFYCWKDCDNNEYYGNYVVTKDITLIAEYTSKNVFIVTFQKQTADISKMVIEDNTISPLSNEERFEKGYTFIAWYSDEMRSEKFDFENTIITENITIYGEYNINVYNVTFVGIDDDELGKLTVEYNNHIENWSQINTNTVGYTFINWCSDESCSEVFDFENTAITKDITIYGKYSKNVYNVTFFGIDNDELSNLTVEYNNHIEDWAQINTETAGYTFINWYSDKSCSAVFDFKNAVVTQDITIYAKYQINVYNITFIGLDRKELAIFCLEYNEQITNIQSINSDEEGYDFVGWYMDEGFNTLFNFEEFLVKEDCYIYARYAIKSYNIYLCGQEGEQLGAIEMRYNQTIRTSALPVEEVAGYDFVGWYFDANLTLPFESKIVEKDLNIYAKYEKKTFTVVFMGLDEEILSTCNVKYGESASPPCEEICNIEGYAFEGFDSEYDNITRDTAINAVYIPIVYMDDQGNILENNFAPLKEGYEFLEWSQIKENGLISYVPLYQPIIETDIPANEKGDILFNDAFLDIMLRVAIILVLAILIILVKAKKLKK